MKSTVRTRFWVESTMACLCGVLGLVTMLWNDWIEAVTGLDPDAHDGSFEWMVVAGLFLICVVLSVAARAEWRRVQPALPGGA